jgi:hypothetical protein
MHHAARKGATGMSTYQIRGRSIIKLGNYLVQDRTGHCFVYFGATGELSATTIDPSFAEAMLQSYEWEACADDEWLTLPELKARSTVRLPGMPSSHDVQQEGY